jgi:hypothetical protein
MIEVAWRHPQNDHLYTMTEFFIYFVDDKPIDYNEKIQYILKKYPKLIKGADISDFLIMEPAHDFHIPEEYKYLHIGLDIIDGLYCAVFISETQAYSPYYRGRREIELEF